MFNSTTAQRIASLVLSTNNGTDVNSTFVLNASNNIRTQVYLVPVNSTASSNATEGSPIQVNLKVPIFVASTASVQPYCATFDPSPDAPAPLSVMPCLDDESAHESQKFLYDPSTGVIHPDWIPSPSSQNLLQSVPDSVDDSAQDDASAMSAAPTAMAEAVHTGSDSMTVAAAPTATSAPLGSTTTNPPALQTDGPSSPTHSTSFSTSASNVTLIFSPTTPSALYESASESSSGPSSPAAYSQMNVRSERRPAYEDSDEYPGEDMDYPIPGQDLEGPADFDAVPESDREALSQGYPSDDQEYRDAEGGIIGDSRGPFVESESQRVRGRVLPLNCRTN